MKPVLTILLLFAMIITAPGCHQETEQERVNEAITNIHKAVERKDINKVISNLSKTYRDQQGNNIDTIKELMLGYFLRYPKISVYITTIEISVEDSSAKAAFQTVLTGSSATGSAARRTPEVLGMYDFVVLLKKEPEGWKVSSAEWKSVGENEIRGGR